jgi:hypothetical protein
MATYSTDLTTLTTAEAGTWTEFNSPYNGGGTPGASGEQYIQGTDCYSQNTGKANGLEISCVFDYGSGYTFGTDEVVLAWLYYAFGTNLESYANSGWRFGIGSGTGTWDWFRVGGSDYSSHKYGGWFNFAIDPTATESGTIGGGNGGTYRYYGNVPYTINEVTKGDPVAVDAIRAGRGEISITGSGGSFSELAQYNDYNAGGTPPGTSSTTVDSGYHVLGLFQAAGGSYLWKGLMSLGLTGTSVTFSDSNEAIIIDDCPHTYAEFNKIEINNASSSVTLTNISFISTATTVALGRFEVVDNATVTLNGCTFNNMDTFIFLSNSTASGCVWNGCGAITANSADFTGSTINSSTVGTDGSALIWDTASDPDGELDNTSFIKGTDTAHAIEFGTNVPTSLTLRGVDFSGYNAADGQNDSTFYFRDVSPTSITLNLVNCTGNVSYKTDGANITIVQDPVTVSITVSDQAMNYILGARAYLKAANGTGPLPYQESVSITSTAGVATVSHTAHGLATGKKVEIKGANEQEYNGVKTITVTGTDSYTYDLDSPYPSSPATGTIVSTGVVIEGTTDSSGYISDSRTYSTNQPVTGVIRKATTSPIFKDFTLAGTINSTSGLDISVQLVLDE